MTGESVPARNVSLAWAVAPWAFLALMLVGLPFTGDGAAEPVAYVVACICLEVAVLLFLLRLGATDG